jgi:hypothetical protein
VSRPVAADQPLAPEGAFAPDLIAPVIGFRHWRLDGSELWSVRMPERWNGGVQTAHCAWAAHAEAAPAHDCSCGIYAWYAPPPRGAAAGTPDLVAGAVIVWGQVELHARGMRAEHATVVALALPFSRWGKRRRLLAVAQALGVPAVPARRLRAAALSCGEPIPRRMRPVDTEPNKRKAPGEPAPARLYAVADGYPGRLGARDRPYHPRPGRSTGGLGSGSTG